MTTRRINEALDGALAKTVKAIKASKCLRELASSGNSNTCNVLEAQCNELSKGIFQLIVLGEFKNGKSTLLNSFLGARILPAKQTPATAIITRVYYGDPAGDVVIFYANGEQARISQGLFRESFKLELEDHEPGVEDRFKDILYADVPSNLNLCRDGVILVDSPGLAENPARTKVTQGFFKQSTGSLLILDATQPVSEEEERWARDLIRSFGADGVFFVVNKINLVDDEEREDTERYIRKRIAQICDTEENGRDLGRIYFVDARRALRSKCDNNGLDQDFERSGVKGLLEDLTLFLSSSGREKTAITRLHRSTSELLTEHQQIVNEWKSAACTSIGELKDRKHECKKRLERLETKAEEIKETLEDAGLIIAQATYENLERFITERERKWEKEARDGMPLTGVSAWDGFTAPFERLWGLFASNSDSPNKAKIEREVEKGVQNYIQRILVDWAEQLPEDEQIDSTITRVSGKVKQEIKEISIDLEAIKSVFSGVSSGDTEADASRMTQALLGALMLDPSQVTGSILGSGDWGAFLVRFVLQIVVAGVLSAIWWPAAIIAWVLQEAFHIAWQADGFDDRIRAEVGKQMFPKIKQDLRSKAKDLKERVQEQFHKSGESVFEKVIGEIRDVETQQQVIVRTIEEDSNRVWEQIRVAQSHLKIIEECVCELKSACSA